MDDSAETSSGGRLPDRGTVLAWLLASVKGFGLPAILMALLSTMGYVWFDRQNLRSALEEKDRRIDGLKDHVERIKHEHAQQVAGLQERVKDLEVDRDNREHLHSAKLRLFEETVAIDALRDKALRDNADRIRGFPLCGAEGLGKPTVTVQDEAEIIVTGTVSADRRECRFVYVMIQDIWLTDGAPPRARVASVDQLGEDGSWYATVELKETETVRDIVVLAQMVRFPNKYHLDETIAVPLRYARRTDPLNLAAHAVRGN